MSLKDEIDKLWNEANEGLQVVTENAIELLNKSLKQKEEIPLETALDIILTANTTIGFGGEFDQAKLILDVYHILIKSKEVDNVSKSFRFTCLVYSVIYTLLSVDETTEERNVPNLMKSFGIDENSSRIQIIRTLLKSSHNLFGNVRPMYWKLELISFIITGICLIDNFDTLNDEDLEIEKIISEITRETDNESDTLLLNKWNARWLEASDYFRLTCLLIFGKHPKDEDAWMNRVKLLTE